MPEQVFDLAIIGGGINGCGIARDAAGRGLSVFLCERDDLASGTSSASTKLIHGGLRYLQYREFRLVREALIEREVLWRMAPHIIRPLRFVLPHHSGLRPAWLLRLGLFIYDHLGGRALLPASRRLRLDRDPAGQPLKSGYRLAFEYSDCWADDARLVVLNAMDAKARGAVVQTRTSCIAARRQDGAWTVTTQDQRTGAKQTIRARLLINAAGPWIANVLDEVVQQKFGAKIRLVQGSHIVVPKLFDHDRCYIFQNTDNRIVFAIPYERDFTLVGTTDLDFQGEPDSIKASADEIAYLCAAVNEYFTRSIAPKDVVWTYSGVRPLYDDGASEAQEVTRDYVLSLDAPDGSPPLLNIVGGKITTFRRLAEAALATLAPFLPADAVAKAGWTRGASLPGGEFPTDGFSALVAEMRARHAYLAPEHAVRLARAYGTHAMLILHNTRQYADLGRRFGADLTEREVAYLMDHEWAVAAADVVWRRSKLGLRMSAVEIDALDRWMADRAMPQRVTAAADSGAAS